MTKSRIGVVCFSLVINFLAPFFFNIELVFADVLVIHTFLFALFFFTDLIQTKLSKKTSIAVFTNLSIHFLRILLCVIFLLPDILNFESTNKNYIYNFFFVYFFILFSEVYLKVKSKREINQ